MNISRAPNYLDSHSGLENIQQVNKVNSVVKSQINLFIEKATEKTKDRKVETLVKSKWRNVDITYNQSYRDQFFVSGQISIGKDLIYNIAELDKKIISMNTIGFFDENLTIPLAQYGSIVYEDGKLILKLMYMPVQKTLKFQIFGEVSDEPAN